MNVTFNNRDPVYVQVVRHFKEQIIIGKFEPGQEIPSRRELARKLKINPNTAQRAYKEMEEQGLIYTEGNSPSKVTTDEHIIGSVREELLMNAVSIFMDSIQPIKIPIDELVDLIREKHRVESQLGEEDIND